jgi:hypothetical protein
MREALAWLGLLVRVEQQAQLVPQERVLEQLLVVGLH